MEKIKQTCAKISVIKLSCRFSNKSCPIFEYQLFNKINIHNKNQLFLFSGSISILQFKVYINLIQDVN